MTPTSRRVLILSSVRWGYLWQRHQALARAAAEAGWLVDYVEPLPRSIGHVLGFLKKRATATLQRLDHGLVPEGIRILGVRDLLVPLAHAPYELALIYTPDPLSLLLLRSGRPRHVIYDAVLDWPSVPDDWGRPLMWQRIESALVSKPGVVATTDGPGIQSRLQSRGIRSSVVPPAADPAFHDPSRTIDFSQRENRALYFGAVHPEIDLDVLSALIRDGVPVDVIGPVQDEMRSALSDLGIKAHPPVTVDELAAIASTYKVVLLPYRGGRAASTVIPAKLWNCLAVGSWVLTSGLDTVVEHPALVRVTPSSAPEVARKCFASPPDTSRESVPSWSQRWEEMVALAGVEPA